jgi:hypothetical protein
MEFDFGGVAEGVEDAEEEIGEDVFSIAVHVSYLGHGVKDPALRPQGLKL